MKQFQIIPAIDIKNGECVRLTQGRFEDSIIYNNNPLMQAKTFAAAGFEYLHVVDLDGAMQGKPINFEVIQSILQKIKIKTQVAGGIRTFEQAKTYLDVGAWEIILGTSALKQQDFISKTINIFRNDKLSIALDFRAGQLATQGWLEAKQVDIADFTLKLKSLGIKRFIVTDITKDGMLNGANYNLAKKIKDLTNCEVIVSGGVSSINEVKLIKAAGLDGVIIGKALYENIITFEKLLNVN